MGERENRAVVFVEFVVDLNVCAHEGVKVEQANGDVGAIGFMAGFLGEAAGANVELAVSWVKLGNERPDRKRNDHGALAMLDLGDNAWAFKPEDIGRSDHVAAAVGAIGRDSGVVAHGFEHAGDQAFHILPLELVDPVLDEFDAIVVDGGDGIVVVGGIVIGGFRCVESACGLAACCL